MGLLLCDFSAQIALQMINIWKLIWEMYLHLAILTWSTNRSSFLNLYPAVTTVLPENAASLKPIAINMAFEKLQMPLMPN